MFYLREPVNALTHLTWAIIGIPSWYYLVSNKQNKLTLNIFMLTAELCYFSSFMYHAVSYPWIQTFALCDHICIFLLIAGTYTPIVYKYCPLDRTIILFWVWGFALVGILLRLAMGQPYEFMYLGMGWGLIVVICYYDFLRTLFCKEFILIVLGGMFYTVGTVLELKRIPSMYHHEVFHCFVMSGTSCHYLFFARKSYKW